MVPNLCDCPKSKDFVAHMESQKLMQFLMGLNESYDHARSQILMTTPTPSVNKAYYMLIERESQRTMASTSIMGQENEVATLLASKRDGYQKSQRNWELQCDHCHMKGHTKLNCYRLIGYPQNYFKNKKKVGQENTAYNVHTEMTENSSNDRNMQRAPTFNNGQYDQIVKLLDKEKSHANMVNMAGMIHSFMANIEQEKWIIDTGASNHMTAYLDNLSDVRIINPEKCEKVYLPNGGVTLVSHTGKYKLTGKEDDDMLEDVG